MQDAGVYPTFMEFHMQTIWKKAVCLDLQARIGKLILLTLGAGVWQAHPQSEIMGTCAHRMQSIATVLGTPLTSMI